jgi:hypothetical protein
LPVGRDGAEQKARRSEGRRQLHDGAPRSVELGASATMAFILFNDRYIHLRLVYAPKRCLSNSSTGALQVVFEVAKL